MKFNKKNVYLIIGLVLSAFFIWGCTTAPEPEEKGPEDAAVTVTEESAPAEETPAEPEEVIVIIDLLQRENSYFADGTLDEYTLYTYTSENTELISQELFTSKEEPVEKRTFSYKDGMLIREDIFDTAGKIQSYYLYTYDAAGNLLSEETFDNEDQLQLRSIYEYDSENNRTKWSVFGGNEAILSYTEYTLENGKNIKTETFTSAGVLDVFFEYEYDGAGNMVKSSQFEPDGDLMGYREYEYAAGTLTKVTVYRKNGSVLRSETYTNNERGNPTEIIYTKAGDKIQERITREYSQLETVEYIEN